jgi:hypothetical protein
VISSRQYLYSTGIITSYVLVLYCLEKLPSPLFKTYAEFYRKLVDWFQYEVWQIVSIPDLLILQSNAEVSLNKEKDKVKGGGGMWSAPPTTVQLDGTAKGKIMEKTDVGMTRLRSFLFSFHRLQKCSRN